MARYIVQHRRGTMAQWTAHDTIIPKEGELVIEIDEENSLHKLKIGDGIHTYAELAYLMAGDEVVSQVLKQALPRVVTVTLDVDKWTEVTCATDPNLGYYGQTVELNNVTEYSRLDLQPNADMLAEFKNLNLVFVTENKGGAITVYSVGDMPLKSYTMQATIVETDVLIDSEKIVGIPVGTTAVQADWNQTDETKSDYIKNKPGIDNKIGIDIDSPDAGLNVGAYNLTYGFYGIRIRSLINDASGKVTITIDEQDFITNTFAGKEASIFMNNQRNYVNVLTVPNSTTWELSDALIPNSVFTEFNDVKRPAWLYFANYELNNLLVNSGLSTVKPVDFTYLIVEFNSPTTESKDISAGDRTWTIPVETSKLQLELIDGVTEDLVKGALDDAYGADSYVYYLNSTDGHLGVLNSTVGYQNVNAGYRSLNVGGKNISASDGTFTTGYRNEALGYMSTVLGSNNEVRGAYDVIAGYGNKTDGDQMCATSSPKHRHLIGFGNEVYNGVNAVYALGQGLRTGIGGQTLLGLYNEEDADATTIIGSGDKNNRANALVVKKDGTVDITKQGLRDDSIVKISTLNNAMKSISVTSADTIYNTTVPYVGKLESANTKENLLKYASVVDNARSNRNTQLQQLSVLTDGVYAVGGTKNTDTAMVFYNGAEEISAEDRETVLINYNCGLYKYSNADGYVNISIPNELPTGATGWAAITYAFDSLTEFNKITVTGSANDSGVNRGVLAWKVYAGDNLDTLYDAPIGEYTNDDHDLTTQILLTNLARAKYVGFLLTTSTSSFCRLMELSVSKDLENLSLSVDNEGALHIPVQGMSGDSIVRKDYVDGLIAELKAIINNINK